MEEAGLGRTALSAREVERAGVLRRVKEGKLKLVSAAQLLGISPRQGKRLWKRYQEQGIQGLQHRAAGRRSNRAKPEKFRKQRKSQKATFPLCLEIPHTPRDSHFPTASAAAIYMTNSLWNKRGHFY